MTSELDSGFRRNGEEEGGAAITYADAKDLARHPNAEVAGPSTPYRVPE